MRFKSTFVRTPMRPCTTRAVGAPIYDIGRQDSNYGTKDQFVVLYEVERPWIDNAGTEHSESKLLAIFYTKSMNERSRLRIEAESRLGRKLTADEITNPNVPKLVGLGEQVRLVVTVNGNGREQIQAILPPLPGAPLVHPLWRKRLPFAPPPRRFQLHFSPGRLPSSVRIERVRGVAADCACCCALRCRSARYSNRTPWVWPGSASSSSHRCTVLGATRNERAIVRWFTPCACRLRITSGKLVRAGSFTRGSMATIVRRRRTQGSTDSRMMAATDDANSRIKPWCCWHHGSTWEGLDKAEFRSLGPQRPWNSYPMDLTRLHADDRRMR